MLSFLGALACGGDSPTGPTGAVDAGTDSTERGPPADSQWDVIVRSGEITDERQDGSSWDEDSAPDVYVCLESSSFDTWCTPAVESLTPTWDTTAPVPVDASDLASTTVVVLDQDEDLDEKIAKRSALDLRPSTSGGETLDLTFDGTTRITIRLVPAS